MLHNTHWFSHALHLAGDVSLREDDASRAIAHHHGVWEAQRRQGGDTSGEDNDHTFPTILTSKSETDHP